MASCLRLFFIALFTLATWAETPPILVLEHATVIDGISPEPLSDAEYYKRAHVRKLFQRLDGWIRRRIWSHRYRRWRNAGWKRLPAAQLYGEYELVRLIYLIPSLAS